MKNLVSLFVLMLLATLTAQAQQHFIVTPNPSDTTSTAAMSPAVAYAKIKNLTYNKYTIRWTRKIVMLSPNLETQICDPVQCWFSGVNTKTFTLDPHETSILYVNFAHLDDQEGCGVVHLNVRDENNPSDSLTARYYYNPTMCGVNVGTNNPFVQQVTLAPNPATEYFTVIHTPEVAVIRLLQMDGRELTSFNAVADQRYYIGNQPVGTYVLVFENAEGRMLGAKEIVKQ